LYSRIFLLSLYFFYCSTEQIRQISDIFDLISFVIQKITVFSKILCSRLLSTIYCRIIAIDKFELQTVEILTEYFYKSFKTCTLYFICFCSTISVEIVNSDLRDYSRVIIYWNSLWKHFFQISFLTNSVNTETPSIQQQYTLLLSKLLSAESIVESICINIVFFSPLILVFKIVSKIILSDFYIEHKLWR